ncbi:MAG: hypothetical protein K8T10_15320 [Candidatus Eremiobacteraeota bacterium]|nr:hypothetical protein [Candidatus Eremiobacteraeota bacterium]
MHLELYQYVEGDKDAEVGEYLGYIYLDEDDVVIDIDNNELAENLEQLFSEPIQYSDGPLEAEKEVEPYTPDFFKCVIPILSDYVVRGILKDVDEIEPIENRSFEDEEDIDSDVDPSQMGMSTIDGMTEDLEIADQMKSDLGLEEEERESF